MKSIFLILLFSITAFVFKTKEINQLKREAKKLYHEKKYLDAVKLYARLESEYKVNEPELIYNHANACYRSLQLKTAMKYYKVIAEGNDSLLASQALNQMGIICCRSNQIKQGKSFFMDAIRKHPSNTKAILNLEWTINKLDELPKKNASSEQEKQKAKDKKQTPNQSGSDQKTDPEGDQKESQSLRSIQHRNKYMDMNKARLLLESMKNAEKQYLHHHPIYNPSHANEPSW